MNSEFFGELQYEENAEWYTCNFDYLGLPIELSIDSENEKVDLKAAENIINALVSRNIEIKEYIEQEYYPLYKQTWAPILFKASRKNFKKRLEPNGIVIYVTGELDVYFNDGGLFKGHDVVVRFDKEQGFYNARLSG
tara:strand:- start:57 stop:467 length:411 start_codon:yes stop_codon:yes gene_type:complete